LRHGLPAARLDTGRRPHLRTANDGAAAASRETVASRTAPFDIAITGPLLQRSRASVSEERWRRCRDHGQALRPAEAVASALSDAM